MKKRKGNVSVGSLNAEESDGGVVRASWGFGAGVVTISKHLGMATEEEMYV